MQVIQNYIDGSFRPALSGQTLDNYEPATGAVYGSIPDSDAEDIQQAVDAAKAAFPAWSTSPLAERHRLLEKLAQAIEGNLDRLAQAESRDNGKPVSLATKVDIPRAASNFRFFATAAMQFSSESHHTPGQAINYTLRQPIGLVGCISPWNLPLYLFTWKIAPALAAGNCVIAKPSEVTPYTSYLLSTLAAEVGFPPGVLNIVHGLGPRAGETIVQHPDIKAITFTGCTRVGEHIARVATPMFKKVSLELGGKNPNIIFADCDYDKMLETSLRSSFANQGQICLCGSRIFVEKSIYERFRNDFVDKVKRMKVGDPTEADTNLGALVSKPHLEKVASYVSLAQEEGGTVLSGGKSPSIPGRCANGYFFEPTVIEGLTHTCRTNQEEIFGPVVTIMPFENEAEALTMANSTPYGLSATIWTSNLNRAQRMAQQIQAGIVWINTWMLRDLRTPFGGVKQSGVGREGGFEAMRFFTEAKNVCIAY
jgi:aminomuconate-semialdehyde/2-hydroxymuconate-6-semialdehyde dehydrogenase